jgi:molybdopterin-containing oxidoreductase family membrane subunit
VPLGSRLDGADAACATSALPVPEEARLRRFVAECLRLVLSGGRAYRAWIAFLLCAIAVGAAGFVHQARSGLLATSMRDEVSWGFYVGNFTFLVGVAAAAVMLVVPAYVYHWKPIKEVVVLGELLAISALVMCLLFVLADMGRPDRALHLAPLLGTPNWPRSLLVWDALVLNLYLALNAGLVLHVLHRTFHGREPSARLFVPLVLLSIPVAVAVHTVTAFLFGGMAARPYWNASILAPRFLASAFAAGPAVMVVLFQILRRVVPFPVRDEAILKIAELMAWAMFVNLFLLGAELFKELYSGTWHSRATLHVWAGLGPHRALVPFAWASLACNVAAFLLLLVPATRRRFLTLNAGCVLVWIGVWLEKGFLLVVGGLAPDALGAVYDYRPTGTELAVAAGVFGVGFLVFTALVKIAVPILYGTFRAETVTSSPVGERLVA